ncbi:MAG: hypothetical protein O2816_19315 [Planctomycetota bacterium]|nr:hypothetical protein [Planctomycetota bacterium]
MHTEHQERRPASGTTRTSDGTSPRQAWLHWTDPETGDRIRVELWSSASFLEGLKSRGFEDAHEHQGSSRGDQGPHAANGEGCGAGDRGDVSPQIGEDAA